MNGRNCERRSLELCSAPLHHLNSTRKEQSVALFFAQPKALAITRRILNELDCRTMAFEQKHITKSLCPQIFFSSFESPLWSTDNPICSVERRITEWLGASGWWIAPEGEKREPDPSLSVAADLLGIPAETGAPRPERAGTK